MKNRKILIKAVFFIVALTVSCVIAILARNSVSFSALSSVCGYLIWYLTESAGQLFTARAEIANMSAAASLGYAMLGMFFKYVVLIGLLFIALRFIHLDPLAVILSMIIGVGCKIFIIINTSK